MYPILFTIGSFHIYSLSVAFIFAWLMFSFLFWRSLRNQGIPEERIFDLTFYSTISAFLFARAGFVATHWTQFQDNAIRIAAIWIAPGMSLYGALFGGLVVLVFLSRRYKVRLGHVLDAFGPALGAAFILGAIGALLDGTYVGVMSNVPWAIRYVGHLGKRHPVQLYEIVAMLFILIAMIFFIRRAVKRQWPFGLAGLWFFALFTIAEFVLEFFRDTPVYLGGLRANQWILVALFAETMGAFYVRGGGREVVRPLANRIVGKISRVWGSIYGKLSKRSA